MANALLAGIAADDGTDCHSTWSHAGWAGCTATVSHRPCQRRVTNVALGAL